ncbi:MAG: type III secretion system export apparatus subunit SctR [Lentisphaeria bacterium]|nr:type III secretion system export apparatus subunit SctR [Lentisphaeria bacterium]
MFQTDPFALIVLFVGLSLVPFVAMIATSYLKIVVVMSLIRNALGVQSIPPNMVLNAMAMILTFYIMAPICNESWEIIKTEKAAMVQREKTDTPPAEGEPQYETDIVGKASAPFTTWLQHQTGDRAKSFFVSTAEVLWAKEGEQKAEVDPDSFYILIPSFCVSELTKAFQIGFLVYLPFIAIDIIISNILLAMGMMMVSPVTISLPFKLLLFVMVDGWTLLIQGLVRSYIL